MIKILSKLYKKNKITQMEKSILLNPFYQKTSELDKEKRKASLSIKELEKYNEKVAIEKYGKDGSSSGAVLGDILGKVFKSKKKKEKK